MLIRDETYQCRGLSLFSLNETEFFLWDRIRLLSLNFSFRFCDCLMALVEARIAPKSKAKGIGHYENAFE